MLAARLCAWARRSPYAPPQPQTHTHKHTHKHKQPPRPTNARSQIEQSRSLAHSPTTIIYCAGCSSARPVRLRRAEGDGPPLAAAAAEGAWAPAAEAGGEPFLRPLGFQYSLELWILKPKTRGTYEWRGTAGMREGYVMRNRCANVVPKYAPSRSAQGGGGHDPQHRTCAVCGEQEHRQASAPSWRLALG